MRFDGIYFAIFNRSDFVIIFVFIEFDSDFGSDFDIEFDIEIDHEFHRNIKCREMTIRQSECSQCGQYTVFQWTMSMQIK